MSVAVTNTTTVDSYTSDTRIQSRDNILVSSPFISFSEKCFGRRQGEMQIRRQGSTLFFLLGENWRGNEKNLYETFLFSYVRFAFCLFSYWCSSNMVVGLGKFCKNCKISCFIKCFNCLLLYESEIFYLESFFTIT